MIDPTLFGLQPETEVKFFTPEDAAKLAGVSSGYNAVIKVSETRTRYELLKAGKAIDVFTPAAANVAAEFKEVISEPVVEPNQEPVTEKEPEQEAPVSEPAPDEVAEENTAPAAPQSEPETPAAPVKAGKKKA